MGNDIYVVCNCGAVELSISGAANVHAYCHCSDCRDLLDIPFHAVTAWDAEAVQVTKGEDRLTTFQHPEKTMSRVFCKNCGTTLYNTNIANWRVVSQYLIRRSNQGELPEPLQSDKHFYYAEKVVAVDDDLEKRE